MPPLASHLIPRPRLRALLDYCPPLTWVQAPAGGGKTALLAAYVVDRAGPVVWVDLAGTEGQVGAFSTALSAAGVPIAAPDADFNMFLRALPTGTTLVIDAAERLPDDAPLYESISRSLPAWAAGVRVFVLSRRAPPPGLWPTLSSLHGRSIPAPTLRFDQEEAAALATSQGVRDAVRVKALWEDTGGWPALLAHALQQASLASDGVWARLWDGLPAWPLSWFPLLSLSQFHESAATCLSSSPGESGLEALAAYAVSDGPVWRWIPAWRRRALADAAGRLGRFGLMRQAWHAARHFEKAGRLEDALLILMEWDCAFGVQRLLARQGEALLARASAHTLARLRGLQTKFGPHPQRRPWLHYWANLTRLRDDPGSVRAALHDCRLAFDKAGDVAGALATHDGQALLTLLGWPELPAPAPGLTGEVESVPEVATAYLTVRPAGCGELPRLRGLRVYYRLRAQPCPVSVDPTRVWARESAGAGDFSNAGDFPGAAMAAAFADLLWGRLDRAAITLESLAVSAGGFGAPSAGALQRSPFAEFLWQLAHARHAWLSGNGGLAEILLVRAEALADGWGALIPALQAERAQAALALGDSAAADANVTWLEKQAPAYGATRLAFLKAGIALFCGRYPIARLHAERVLAALAAPSDKWLEFDTRLVLVASLTELGEFAAAADHLEAAGNLMGLPQPTLAVYAWLFAGAYLSLCRDGETACLPALSGALGLAARENYHHVRPYWHPSQLARLCEVALRHDIHTEFIRDLIRSRSLLPLSQGVENWPWPIRVYTLGRFALLVNDREISAGGKAQRKPLDLLKALIALGGRDVSPSSLITALWPDSAGDTAQQTFDTTLHRLRKLLIHPQALELRGGRVSLNSSVVWADVWAFERLYNDSMDVGRNAKAADAAYWVADLGRRADSAFRIYQGHFLAHEDEQPWMFLRRERLRSRFLRHIESYGRLLQESGDYLTALTLYRKGIEFDPLAEPFYRETMRCLMARGEMALAMDTYRRLEKTLSVVFAIRPSAETLHIFQKIKKSS